MSIVLSIGNSYSQVAGLSAEAFKALKEELSYNTDSQAAYFAGGRFPKRKSLLDKRGEFPSGLLYRVKQFLRLKGLPFNAKDTRMCPGLGTAIGLKSSITPRQSQLDAMAASLQNSQGTISMPTGSGKSLVIALIAAALGLRTLVVVPTLGIKEQLIKNINKTLKNSTYVQVENIDSNLLKILTNFDVLIIDEAHHAGAKTYQRLNKTAWKNIYYRFFLTATPWRTNPEENLIFEGIAGKLIYNLTYAEAVDLGYIVPIEAFYIEVPKQPTSAYAWQEVYKELVINNHLRNTLISQCMLNLTAAGLSALCLVKEIPHGNALSAMTNIPFVNGQDKASRPYIQEFSEGLSPGMIGTTGVVGEGIDTLACEYVIIAGLGKAKGALMQQFGRAVRTFKGKETAKVILIKDSSHKFTLTHFKTQAKLLKEEYGVKLIKLEV